MTDFCFVRVDKDGFTQDLLVHAFAADQGVQFLIMDLLPGENLDTLLDRHRRQVKKLRDMLDAIGIPLHPGAERFYKEAGILK